jgi:CTP:molybdopterin cytidylyltransferase MocA
VSQLAGIILAAGTSSAFGAANKLLASWGGQPMVRTVAEAALATELDPVIVVTGHESEQVERRLPGWTFAAFTIPDYSQRSGVIVASRRICRSTQLLRRRDGPAGRHAARLPR